MSVFREVTIEFNGAGYTFVPSNKLLRKIDAGLSPQTLFGVLGQMDGKEAPLPALAYVIAEFLNAGGGEFDEDDILIELVDDVRNNNGEGIRPLVEAIGDCLSLPDRVPEGNGGSPAKSRGGKKSKRSQSE